MDNISLSQLNGDFNNESLDLQIKKMIDQKIASGDPIDQAILCFYPNFFANELNLLIRLYFDKYMVEKNNDQAKHFLFIYSETAFWKSVGSAIMTLLISPNVIRIKSLSNDRIEKIANANGKIGFGTTNGRINIQELKRGADGRFVFPRNTTAQIIFSTFEDKMVFHCEGTVSKFLSGEIYSKVLYEQKELKETPWVQLSVPLIIIATQKQCDQLLDNLFSNGRKISDTFPAARYKDGQLVAINPFGLFPSIINARSISDAEAFVKNFKIEKFNILSLNRNIQNLKKGFVCRAQHIVAVHAVEQLFDQESSSILAGQKNQGTIGMVSVDFLDAMSHAESDNALLKSNPEVYTIDNCQEINSLVQKIVVQLKEVIHQNTDSANELFFRARKLLLRMLYPVIPDNIDNFFEFLTTSAGKNGETGDNLLRDLKMLYSMLCVKATTPKLTHMTSWLQTRIGKKAKKLALLVNTRNAHDESLSRKVEKYLINHVSKSDVQLISYSEKTPCNNAVYMQCGKTTLQKIHFIYPLHYNSFWFLYPVEMKILKSFAKKYQYLLKSNNLDIDGICSSLDLKYSSQGHEISNQFNSALTIEYNLKMDDESIDDFDIFSDVQFGSQACVLVDRTLKLKDGYIHCTEEFELYVPEKQKMCPCNEIVIGDKILVESVETRDNLFQKLIDSTKDDLDAAIAEKCPLLLTWHNRLDQFMIENGYTNSQLCTELKEDYGLDISYPTVRGWRLGLVKAPREKKHLEAIAMIMGDDEILSQVPKIIKYANQINTTNQQSGMRLKQAIYNALIRGKTEFDSVPINQFFQLVEVIEIIPGDDEEIPRSQTNIFIKRNGDCGK